mmetsp:Transcript_130210/g.225125  ORF Transcript_130210/g.225125 Transcript_130210/m.225125 type:complete len:311 (+) Transcript_130210:1117-2049(+)
MFLSPLSWGALNNSRSSLLLIPLPVSATDTTTQELHSLARPSGNQHWLLGKFALQLTLTRICPRLVYDTAFDRMVCKICLTRLESAQMSASDVLQRNIMLRSFRSTTVLKCWHIWLLIVAKLTVAIFNTTLFLSICTISTIVLTTLLSNRHRLRTMFNAVLLAGDNSCCKSKPMCLDTEHTSLVMWFVTAANGKRTRVALSFETNSSALLNCSEVLRATCTTCIHESKTTLSSSPSCWQASPTSWGARILVSPLLNFPNMDVSFAIGMAYFFSTLRQMMTSIMVIINVRIQNKTTNTTNKSPSMSPGCCV